MSCFRGNSYSLLFKNKELLTTAPGKHLGTFISNKQKFRADGKQILNDKCSAKHG